MPFTQHNDDASGKKRILIVEDDQHFRFMLQEAFGHKGFEVMVFDNPDQAIRVIKYYLPDIILLDINLDHRSMDGLELCLQIRAQTRSTARIIIMSGLLDERKKIQAYRSGAVACLAKPFNLTEALALIESLLDVKPKWDAADALDAVAQALEQKDPYTKGHSQTVGQLAVRLGERAGLDDLTLGDLATACELHDLGKIGIPERILLKPGRLDEDEMIIMRTHSSRSVQIIRKVPLNPPIVAGIFHHHERWDGKGYPHGLAGDSIPLLARMIAIPDAYDAMTSDRPYRKGMAIESAVRQLRTNSGTQFDPKLILAFLGVI